MEQKAALSWLDWATLATDEQQRVLQQLAELEQQLQGQEAWSVQALVQQLGSYGSTLLLCYDRGREVVASYCLYQQVFEQAEILRVGTHPIYQRQGLARQGLQRVLETIAQTEVSSLLLEVRTDNLPAIALYQQVGFEQIAVRPGYYPPPQHQSLTKKEQARVDALILQYLWSVS